MISVAMTTYNGEKYLKEQIDSILDQDFRDIELIICDDCSTDNTVHILEEYKNMDDRVKVYINEKNLGFKKNFEKAIRLCKGDYIALADQDDIWLKNHLSVLYKNIKEDQLVCADSLCFEMSNNKTYTLFELEQNVSIVKSNLDVLKRILFRGNFFQGASMLLNKKFIDAVLPIPDTIKFHDVWFVLVASSMNSFNYINEVVNNYRQHNSSVTKRKNKNLFSKIINLPKFRDIQTDRLCYCNELKKINEKIHFASEVSELLDFSISFYSNIENRLFRWATYRRYRKDIFPILYGKMKKKYQFARIIQYLFF